MCRVSNSSETHWSIMRVLTGWAAATWLQHVCTQQKELRFSIQDCKDDSSKYMAALGTIKTLEGYINKVLLESKSLLGSNSSRNAEALSQSQASAAEQGKKPKKQSKKPKVVTTQERWRLTTFAN